jgi:hypothetical protein
MTMDANEAKRAGNARGGLSRSQAKIAASRENGKRGGRPRLSLAELIHREVAKLTAAAKPKLPKVPKWKPPKPEKPLTGAALIDYMHRYGEYRGQKCPCQECEQKRLPPDFNPGR